MARFANSGLSRCRGKKDVDLRFFKNTSTSVEFLVETLMKEGSQTCCYGKVWVWISRQINNTFTFLNVRTSNRPTRANSHYQKCLKTLKKNSTRFGIWSKKSSQLLSTTLFRIRNEHHNPLQFSLNLTNKGPI